MPIGRHSAARGGGCGARFVFRRTVVERASPHTHVHMVVTTATQRSAYQGKVHRERFPHDDVLTSISPSPCSAVIRQRCR